MRLRSLLPSVMLLLTCASLTSATLADSYDYGYDGSSGNSNYYQPGNRLRTPPPGGWESVFDTEQQEYQREREAKEQEQKARVEANIKKLTKQAEKSAEKKSVPHAQPTVASGSYRAPTGQYRRPYRNTQNFSPFGRRGPSFSGPWSSSDSDFPWSGSSSNFPWGGRHGRGGWMD